MNRIEIEQFLQEHKQRIEQTLPVYINTLQAPQTLKQAMSYSLEAGGKRIRPLLLLATLHAFGKEVEVGVPVACAIEMIHTYSLIHDDLPSMDNDDLRRGKPTNHKVFGEAMAILAGDGLLTYAFQVIAEMNAPTVTEEMKVKLIYELAKAAGPEGMVAGQVADMEGEGKELSLEQLEYIHRNKTGKMLQYSVLAGAILAGANEIQLEQLHAFASHLGLAFQIRDDILDIEGSEEKIGKRVGSDVENEKVTYPSLLTLDGAKEKLLYHINEAKRCLQDARVNDDVLCYICDLVATRDH
ncbi:polyprenyl synthetase family protein [Thermaerobacillus caldiproteolyticus]|uniref:Farnesyl diphosphate synthase n=1 Tax=Thermaerobacillus caldiproteolyticus TaxID=247480 RepID=A0A7W0BYT7_9BACL|nr:farnesyl diphosphate synthase [Anoxybacillus caldiproteolyticus]MBA2873414.1 geranylgeranyl diphosphate synthase type II [Anoxybacillus caldiproteolyticus]QPA30003.1 polyprenyl synthetase family protein [Anoxybacillus caldiproteolyticus]